MDAKSLLKLLDESAKPVLNLTQEALINDIIGRIKVELFAKNMKSFSESENNNKQFGDKVDIVEAMIDHLYGNTIRDAATTIANSSYDIIGLAVGQVLRSSFRIRDIADGVLEVYLQAALNVVRRGDASKNSGIKLNRKCIGHIELLNDDPLAADYISKRGKSFIWLRADYTFEFAKKRGLVWGAQIRAEVMSWTQACINEGGDDKGEEMVKKLSIAFLRELQKGNGSTMLWNLGWNDHQARCFFGSVIDGITKPLNEQDLSGVRLFKQQGDDHIWRR